jgi:hypothetical protein
MSPRSGLGAGSPRALFPMDDLITFACGGFEQHLVHDSDLAAAVLDGAPLLKRPGQQRQRGAPDSQHVRQELLRQRQVIGFDPVGALQQPAA